MFLLQITNSTHCIHAQNLNLSVSERVDFVKANHFVFQVLFPNCSVKTCCAKNCFCGKPHNRLIHFPKKDKVYRPQPNSSRSVLNPLADVFGGPGGLNCVVPPQGENEENKSFVATSFLKNKTRTVLLSSVQCFLRDKYGLLHEVRALLDVGNLLISFRSNKIAVLADVEKAFLQISLAPKDRDVVRFLIDDGENGVQVYRFNRVLFGVNASPFLLAATIKTHIGEVHGKVS
ncbi:DUF1758 domain-containing protein [Trichonephila clavipes]|nr:DUF1758 domain-containing protein [Trichonephila clavipes]